MAWQCPGCKDYVENGRVACTSCGTSRGGATSVPRPSAAVDPRRDLAMEGHLRATAFWYTAFGLVGGALIVLGRVRGDGGGGSFVSTIVAAAVCAFVFALGRGLARLSGGARVVAGALTLLGLGGTILGIVRGEGGGLVSTAIALAWNAAYLWLFFSSRARAVTTPAYRQLVRGAPKGRMLASPFFWLPLAGVALLVVVVVIFLGAASALAVAG